MAKIIRCDCCGREYPLDSKEVEACKMLKPCEVSKWGGCVEHSSERDLCHECLADMRTRIERVWTSTVHRD